MLISVTKRGIIVLGCLLLAAAGCTSTTNGTGATGTGSGAPSSGPATHDFPSGSGSGSGPAAPSAGTSAAGTTSPAPSAPLRTVTVHNGNGHNYTVKIWADVKNATCADHAYGAKLISFLRQHPCSGLERILATTSVGGRPVGFAMSSTGFPGTASDPYKYSSEFVRLENANGTGSLNDLLREGYRLPSGPTQVPQHEAFTVVGQDNGVTVWDAWYLTGSTPDQAPALITMAQDLFLQI